MIFVKFVLLVLAIFVTLLWVTKLATDCVSASYGSLTKEDAEKDGILRIYLIAIISILWSIILII